MTPLLIGESRAEEAGPGGRPRGQGSPQAVRPPRSVSSSGGGRLGQAQCHARHAGDRPGKTHRLRAGSAAPQSSNNRSRRTWLGPPVGSPSPGDTAMHRPTPDRMREPWSRGRTAAWLSPSTPAGIAAPEYPSHPPPCTDRTRAWKDCQAQVGLQRMSRRPRRAYRCGLSGPIGGSGSCRSRARRRSRTPVHRGRPQAGSELRRPLPSPPQCRTARQQPESAQRGLTLAELLWGSAVRRLESLLLRRRVSGRPPARDRTCRMRQARRPRREPGTPPRPQDVRQG